MSKPTASDPVKLFIGAFSADPGIIEEVFEALAARFGPVDWRSPAMVFDRTRYYEKEMGWPLGRGFIAFERLIPPESLVEVKLFTNEMEAARAECGRRRVNIDPGYLCAERLVLATGKNYVHRVYLGCGVYADLTLVFSRGGFTTLKWTYPDYAAPGMIAHLNALRAHYMVQLRALRAEAAEDGAEAPAEKSADSSSCRVRARFGAETERSR